jgi:hypothetical protein
MIGGAHVNHNPPPGAAINRRAAGNTIARFIHPHLTLARSRAGMPARTLPLVIG